MAIDDGYTREDSAPLSLRERVERLHRQVVDIHNRSLELDATSEASRVLELIVNAVADVLTTP